MNVALWVLQVLLAVAFLAHARLYLFPPAEMVAAMDAVIPATLRKFIGVAEALAAIGLTLPGITRIKPWLVPLAAAGLMVVMLGAVSFHTSRGEVAPAIITGILFVLCTFVAYMRWRVLPIRSRTAQRSLDRNLEPEQRKSPLR